MCAPDVISAALSGGPMGSEFSTYARLGFAHIADLQAYDHIVFIVALTAGFAGRDWHRLLWLVTAFTLGHSVTLALATLAVVRAPSSLIELLIAATIVVAGVHGMISRGRRPGEDTVDAASRQRTLYAMAGGFGLIHGLGFSSFLRSVLGGEDSILLPLFSFNVGLELGQLLIVLATVLCGTLACDKLGIARHRWSAALSLVATLLGLQMLVARL